jgi:TAP-like protein
MLDDRNLLNLRRLDGGPDPDPAFVARLHDRLARELGFAPSLGSTVPDAQAARQLGRSLPIGRRWAWILVAAALVFALAAGLVLVGAILRDRSEVQYTPGIEAASCPRFAPPTMACSFLLVPERRSKPEGRWIRVFVARIPSTNPSPAHDPLAFVEGPTELEATWLALTLAGNPALEWRDVIWIGQRGAGLSLPSLTCPELREPTLSLLGKRGGEPSANDIVRSAARACRDRLAADGLDLAAYNAEERAADVGDAMRTMGYERWNLESYSLPGVLQLILGNRPEGLRSVIFDSPIPIGADRFGLVRANLVAALAGLQASCNRLADCGTAHANIAGDLARQAGEYDAAPTLVAVPAPNGSTVEVLLDGRRRWEIARLELADNAWIATLPDEFASARSPDLDRALAALLVASTVTHLDDATGAHLSMVCTAEIPFVDRASVEAGAAGSVTDGPVLGPPWELAACDEWPAEPDRGSLGSAASDVPALLFAGSLDPLAPAGGAWTLAARLSASFVVEAPDWTNRLFAPPIADCARSIRETFLADPTRAPDASCLSRSPLSSP